MSALNGRNGTDLIGNRKKRIPVDPGENGPVPGEKRNAANCITVGRMLFSAALPFLSPRSAAFGVLYLLCGLSDGLDGLVARKTGTESQFGARLDSAADLLFLTVCAATLLPLLRLDAWIWIWVAGIAAVRLIGMLLRVLRGQGALLPHSAANRITGLLLFCLPLTFPLWPVRYSVIAVCIVATFAAVREIPAGQTERSPGRLIAKRTLTGQSEQHR